MKKITTLLLVALAALFFSCGKDDDGTKKSPTTLLTVKVNEYYLGSFNTAAYVFASKADGTLLDYKPLANNATITLLTTEDGVTDFTITLLQNISNDPNVPNIQIKSFAEMPVGRTWSLNGSNQTTVTSATLTIEDTGDVWPLAGSSAVGSSQPDTTGNNLSFGFSLFKDYQTLPTLAIYKSTLDDQVRYFYDEAMPVGVPVNVQHTELPIIPSPTIIDFGSTGINFCWVKGVVTSFDDHLSTLSISLDNDFPLGQSEHYIPNGIFDKYFVQCGGSLPNTPHSFGVSLYSDAVETNFTYPDFDFSINPTANGFSISTNDDISEFSVYYTNDAGVDWLVNSPNKTVSSFTMPTLPTELTSIYSILTQPFSYFNGKGIRYDPSHTVADFYENLYPDPATISISEPYSRFEYISHN